MTGPEPPSNPNLQLTDVLGLNPTTKTFHSLLRSTHEPSLTASAPYKIVLAPANAALAEFKTEKPWERGGELGAQQEKAGLDGWVKAHVVLLEEGEVEWDAKAERRTEGGGKVWWEERGNGRVVMPGEVVVEKVEKRVDNGELWVLKGVLDS